MPKSFDKIKSLENQFGAETPILIFSDLKVVDSNLNIINDSFFSYQGVFPNWADDFPHLLMQNVAPGCTMIINRALIDKAGEIPDDALMHDWWFMLVASAFGKIAYIDEPTILYRQHENNCIGAKSSSIISTIKAFLKAPLSIVGVVNQAKAFLDIYDDELKIVLSKNDYGKLILQTQLISLPVHKRWLAVICGGIRKNTFIRNLGLLLALTIFKLK